MGEKGLAWVHREWRWELAAAPEVIGRAFWAVLLGLVMEAAGSGTPVDPTAVEAAVVSALAARPSPR